MYIERHLHDPGQPRRPARDEHPCGLSDGLPVGFQLIGPAFSENRMLEPRTRSSKAIGFETAPTFGDSSLGSGGGWNRAASLSTEDAQS